jgi:hypothetical protein
VSEVTVATIVMLLIIVWSCWLVSVFARWLRHAWRTRHLNGWEGLALFVSAGWLALGLIIYRPAKWWETLGASIILLGAVWTLYLIIRRLFRVWRARQL